MRGTKHLFLASWVLLVILSSVVALASLNSLRRAYFGAGDSLVVVTEGDHVRSIGLEQIREFAGDEGVKAFRGRRATAATWAFGCMLLTWLVTLVPYRRSEKWAWWALLMTFGLSQILSLARAITIATVQGNAASGMILGFALLGLILGIPHIFARRGKIES